MSFILDTNIFNQLADGIITSEDLPKGCSYVATHVQLDEINNTKDSERRARLLLCFATMRPEIVPTESFVWGVARFGHSKLSDGVLYNKMRLELDSLNGSKSNNVNDALIAEVAIKNNYTLITADSDLAEVVKDNSGQVIYHKS